MSTDDLAEHRAEHEITAWIEQLRAGGSEAARAVWDAYFERLVALARRRLAPLARREADEEDVALSALHSFHRGVLARKFPRLEDRHDLWKILATITIRKAVALRRRHFSKKRGGGKTRGESAFDSHSPQADERGGIEQVLGAEPNPEMAAILAEQCELLFGRLDESHKSVALLKTGGLCNLEIAEELNLSLRTVERRLDRVRQIWSLETCRTDDTRNMHCD